MRRVRVLPSTNASLTRKPRVADSWTIRADVPREIARAALLAHDHPAIADALSAFRAKQTDDVANNDDPRK